MASKPKKMSKEDLIKILGLVCNNKNNRFSPNMFRGIFPALDVRDISSFLDEIKIQNIPVKNFRSNGIPSIKYRHGLEEYVENFKKELKKERLHRIVEFLSTNATQTKREFDTYDIAKAFTPELDIYNVNSLCEIIIANGDVIKVETDQSYAKGILILIVTERTHVAYKNKRYLEDNDQFEIPIHQNISAKYVAVGNNSPNIILEDNSSMTNNSKEKPTRLYILYLIIVVLGVVGTFSYNAYRNNKKDNDEYKLNILNYSPQLKVSNCQFSEFKNISTEFSNGVPSHFTKYSTNIVITLKNVGNVNAHLMVSSFRDMATGEQYLRTIKYDKEFPENLKKASSGYYFDKQISPKEELLISITDTIYEVIDNIFTYHFWVVYKNDINMVYDSYYWYRAKITENPVNPLSFIDQANSFYPYSPDESKEMLKMYLKIK